MATTASAIPRTSPSATWCSICRVSQRTGLSKEEIINNYVFFTAGSCGPCRFGMYEAEYRLALQNAGFDGFRVLLFQQNDGVKAASGEAGLKFTVDFGLGMFNALNLGDIMHEMIYRIRPYEVEKGQTDRVFQEAVDALCTMLRERKPFEDHEDLPEWMAKKVRASKGAKWEVWVNSLLKVREQLYGHPYKDALQAVHDQLGTIEVDRLRVKPVVKIIGEFWAQTTEGDGNFHMFEFLEREGAQVLVEPIGTWVMYMMYQVKARNLAKRSLDAPYKKVQPWELHKLAMNELNFRKKQWMIGSRRAHLRPPVPPCGGSAGQHRTSISSTRKSWRRWPTRSTTSSRAAVKATSKSARTFTTPRTACATWCWR